MSPKHPALIARRCLGADKEKKIAKAVRTAGDDYPGAGGGAIKRRHPATIFIAVPAKRHFTILIRCHEYLPTGYAALLHRPDSKIKLTGLGDQASSPICPIYGKLPLQARHFTE